MFDAFKAWINSIRRDTAANNDLAEVKEMEAAARREAYGLPPKEPAQQIEHEKKGRR